MTYYHWKSAHVWKSSWFIFKVSHSSWIQSRRTGNCGCRTITWQWSEMRRRPRRATVRSASPATAATASWETSTSTAAATTGRLWSEEAHGDRQRVTRDGWRLWIIVSLEHTFSSKVPSLVARWFPSKIFSLSVKNTFPGIGPLWPHKGKCHITHVFPTLSPFLHITSQLLWLKSNTMHNNCGLKSELWHERGLVHIQRSNSIYFSWILDFFLHFPFFPLLTQIVMITRGQKVISLWYKIHGHIVSRILRAEFLYKQNTSKCFLLST